MKKEVELGKVKHKCELMGDGDLQVDTFITKIPLECLPDEGIGLLNYWCVEEMDRAHIDWENGCFVLEYTTEHYLPKGHEVEEFTKVV